MKLLSKITFFFLYVVIVFSFLSCEKENTNIQTIPYTHVYTKVSTITHSILGHGGAGTAYIDKDSFGRKIGYRGHGIFVTKIDNDTFYAFDATCTNHNTDYDHTLTFNNELGLKCPDCEIIYNPISGEATNSKNNTPPLQPYRCYNTGNGSIIIQNIRN